MQLKDALEQLLEAHRSAVEQLEGAKCIYEAFLESPERHRPDYFLFYTVYPALWHAFVMGIGTIWDDDRNVVSLPRLQQIKGNASCPELNRYCKGLNGRSKSGGTWKKIKMWRDKVIAHRSVNFPEPDQRGEFLTFDQFGEKYALSIREVEQELDVIFSHLVELDRLAGIHRFEGVGRQPMDARKMKEDARKDAICTLGRWRLGLLGKV